MWCEMALNDFWMLSILYFIKKIYIEMDKKHTLCNIIQVYTSLKGSYDAN